MLGSFNLDKTYHYLLVAIAFQMPITVFGANLIIVIICLLWLLSGDYKSKFNLIIDNKFILASIVFFSLHVIGLLWTEDIIWGLHIVHKMWYFLLLLPVLYTVVRKEYIGTYVSAFLLAIALTELLSFLVWFEIIDEFKNATISNPTPFMSHISYNPIITFAIYLVSHKVLFNKKLSRAKRYIFSFFVISMIFNMFITGGRAGQVMFFAMMGILIFQYFHGQKFKAILAIFIIIPGIFLAAYQASDTFKYRVDIAIINLQNFELNKDSSVGQRITFAVNSWDVVKKNPIIGIGTGDFPAEYKKVNLKNTPELTVLANATNPHNMYILILMQIGFIGLISLLSIFYYQIKLSFMSKNKFIRDVGLTLPLLFLIIMWSDSYLLGHYTTLMYIFFSSFLYKNFEKS
ncbi:O-antigen ligase family protein [Candidatus Thioglobus sp.]|nr:O-antigen ligase family protein [Candidatus Thioglobus sp.]